MTTIYMQLKTDKRAYTKKIDLGYYITATDEQLDKDLAEMARAVCDSEQVNCTYVGSIKQWNAKGQNL